MAFKALNEVFDGRLTLPGKDGEKAYHVPEPDSELGAWCTALFAAGMAINLGEAPPEAGLPPLQLDDDGEEALYIRVLGQALLDELRADGYGHSTVRLFGQTAFMWIAAGQEAAEAFWNSGGDPKVSAPRAARRAAAKARATASTPSTAGVRTTPPAGSTSGTTPRKAPRKAPAGRPSHGK